MLLFSEYRVIEYQTCNSNITQILNDILKIVERNQKLLRPSTQKFWRGMRTIIQVTSVGSTPTQGTRNMRSSSIAVAVSSRRRQPLKPGVKWLGKKALTSSLFEVHWVIVLQFFLWSSPSHYVFFQHCRQQRDEIARKKEKMESMLKGKRNSSTGLRPESPSSRRKRSIKRAIVPTRRLTNARGNMEVGTCSCMAF